MRGAAEHAKSRFARLLDNSGETLVEVLVATVVAGLALLMLAMAISSSTNIIGQGKQAASNYFGDVNNLASVTESDTSTVTVTSKFDASDAGTAVDVSVTYYESGHVPGGGEAVAYRASELKAG